MGKEWKRKGTQAFRRQDFSAAVDSYSQAAKQCPWDISLYTNLALVSRDGTQGFIQDFLVGVVGHCHSVIHEHTAHTH